MCWHMHVHVCTCTCIGVLMCSQSVCQSICLCLRMFCVLCVQLLFVHACCVGVRVICHRKYCGHQLWNHVTCVPSDVLASANVHHSSCVCQFRERSLNDIVTKCFIHCSHEVFLVVLMCECV